MLYYSITNNQRIKNMYNYFTDSKPVRKIESYRVCDTCHNQKETIIDFKKLSDSREFSSTCTECLQTIKGTSVKLPSRQSPLRRRINTQVRNSHKRMLNQALKQRVEVTDPSKLREMYPEFTDLQITRMARLNHKINVANDFLIEEQSYYLNPSERPAGGIDYQAELFEERVFEDDKELSTIQQEQIDIDDQ